jgi:hypothetical protein
MEDPLTCSLRGDPVKKPFFLLLILATAGCLSLFLVRESFAQTLKDLAASLSRQLGAWTAKDPDGIYDRETIFDYINGAGEVYRAHNMQTCLSRRYTASGEPPIVMDIFDMGTSRDAFGVFTHDREGEPADAGQEGLYRPGWLAFWKGRFFVSIYMERETAKAKETAFGLARKVDSLIRERGPKPKVLGLLPPEGLRESSVHYFRHPMLLSSHYFLSVENILHLGPETEALLASYRRGGLRARFLLVLYPDPERARKARNDVLTHYLPEAKEKEAVRLENGKWSAVAQKGRLLAVVLEADSRPLTENLLRGVEPVP